MSYVKNTWQTGDIVTAEKLNHLEDGVASASSGGGGGTFVVTYSYQEIEGEQYLVADKTFAEIQNAMANGIYPYAIFKENEVWLHPKYIYSEETNELRWFYMDLVPSGSILAYAYIEISHSSGDFVMIEKNVYGAVAITRSDAD